MDVLDYVVSETERQSGTTREAVGMLRAYDLFVEAHQRKAPITESLVLGSTSFINGLNGYRAVPAVFNQGMPALPPGDVLRQAMRRWYEMLDSLVSVPGYHNQFDTPREVADYFTLEFLQIHPFADGNGRIGSLVWNFLNNTLYKPVPMPYFFGDN